MKVSKRRKKNKINPIKVTACFKLKGKDFIPMKQPQEKRKKKPPPAKVDRNPENTKAISTRKISVGRRIPKYHHRYTLAKLVRRKVSKPNAPPKELKQFNCPTWKTKTEAGRKN